MCVTSMIGDYYQERYDHHPLQPLTWINMPPAVSRDEFDALRKDVEEMKELLKRAKDYDERTGQPDCEIEDKMAMLRRLADLLGVDLSSVIPAGQA